MARTSCESIRTSFPELPMLHFRGKDSVVVGKVLIISELLNKINYVELKDYLLELFPSKDQLFLLPSVDSENAPLRKMSIEHIENVIFRKQANKLLDAEPDYDTLKASFLSADEEEQACIQNDIRDFADE